MDLSNITNQLSGLLKNVSLKEIFTDSFVKEHTSFESADALFKGLGLNSQDIQEGAKKVLSMVAENPNINTLVAEKTQYSDFNSLLQAATKTLKDS